MVTLHTEAGYPSAGAAARPWRSEIKNPIPRTVSHARTLAPKHGAQHCVQWRKRLSE